jgi:pimeloyl-ACP methyl ester carboxylesterase
MLPSLPSRAYLTDQGLMRDRKQEAISYDMRGHGHSQVAIEEDDLSLNTLAIDAVDLLCTLFPSTMPPLALVGHR